MLPHFADSCSPICCSGKVFGAKLLEQNAGVGILSYFMSVCMSVNDEHSLLLECKENLDMSLRYIFTVPATYLLYLPAKLKIRQKKKC